MDLALSSGSLYSYGLDRVFELAAGAGFDGVEVIVDRRFDTRQVAYLRRLQERFGLPILSMHAPFHPWRLEGWPPTYPRSLAATVELATAVGAGIVVAHLPWWRDRAYARWLHHDLAAWQRGHPEALIALENMPLKWVPWWPWPLDPWQLNRLEQWGTFPHLTLDTTHLATKGLDPLQVYAHLPGQVVHVHLSNARRKGRRVQEHRRLEDGYLSLDTMLLRLASDGYEGIVTVELHPHALEAEDEGRVRAHLRRQVRFCRKHGAISREVAAGAVAASGAGEDA